MRIRLDTQITTALVLFGLVPASIVAWFAYQANDDFKDKQRLIVQQAAALDQRPDRQRRLQPEPEDHRGRADRAASFAESRGRGSRAMIEDGHWIADSRSTRPRSIVVNPDESHARLAAEQRRTSSPTSTTPTLTRMRYKKVAEQGR